MKPKRDQERDLELDKKIEALRRKNEALMKRYKEVEEDRKKAEEEGMALQSRNGKADDLTITISKSTSDSRVVVTKPSGSESPAVQGQQGAESDRGGATPTQAAEPGQTRQLTVTMAGKKGKRVVREKPEKTSSDSADIRNPTEDGQTRRVESARRRKQLPHATNKRDAAAAAAAAAQAEAKQEQRESEELNNQRILKTSRVAQTSTSPHQERSMKNICAGRESVSRLIKRGWLAIKMLKASGGGHGTWTKRRTCFQVNPSLMETGGLPAEVEEIQEERRAVTQEVMRSEGKTRQLKTCL
ncbi:uncharacterized protein ccdc9b isoform X2 [Oryzias latipes]